MKCHRGTTGLWRCGTCRAFLADRPLWAHAVPGRGETTEAAVPTIARGPWAQKAGSVLLDGATNLLLKYPATKLSNLRS